MGESETFSFILRRKMKKWSFFLRNVPEFRPSLLLRAPMAVPISRLGRGCATPLAFPFALSPLSVRGGQGDGPLYVAPRRTCPAQELPCHSSHRRRGEPLLLSSSSSAAPDRRGGGFAPTPAASRWVGPTGTNSAYLKSCGTSLSFKPNPLTLTLSVSVSAHGDHKTSGAQPSSSVL